MKPGRSRNFVRIAENDITVEILFHRCSDSSNLIVQNQRGEFYANSISIRISRLFFLLEKSIVTPLFILYYLKINACAFTVIISMLCPRYHKFFSKPGWGCVRGDNSLQSYSFEMGKRRRERIYTTVLLTTNAISSFYISHDFQDFSKRSNRVPFV